jgi:hypothetical protein
MQALYDYHIPPGYGDIFFCYVLDAQDQNLTDGQSYFGRRVKVANGQFVLRYITGFATIAQQFQFYDWIERRFFSKTATLGGFEGMVVQPESIFADQGDLRMDLLNVAQDVAGVDGALTVYRSQLQFWGVRRRARWESDPQASNYKYFEEPYQYPVDVVIDRYASTGGVLNPPIRFQVPVQNQDFELRRIELALEDPQQLSQFKIQLFDQNFVGRSNLPVLSNYLCHLDPAVSSGELGFFPSPPMLYAINSVISFDVYSLLFAPTVLPQTFRLLFHGVKRFKC